MDEYLTLMLDELILPESISTISQLLLKEETR